MKLLLPLVALAASTGCIIHDNDNDPPPDPYGDIAFDWSFDGIPTCDEAQVDEVDVAIFQDGQLVLDHGREPCEGGGLIFTDIHSGFYEVFVDAYDRNGDVLYSGNFGIRVEGGVTNDAGVVVLENVNGPPEPQPEILALGLYWVFPYPTNETITFDCELAGVDEIDVAIVPLGDDGLAYDDTFNCEGEGVFVEGLPEGRYEITLQGFGSYHDDDLLLYETTFIVDVTPESDLFDAGLGSVELGDVVLDREGDAFSDFDVAWGFVDQSCAGAGLADVTVSFQRFGFDLPEDTVTVPCGDSGVLRPTFVPGSYDVSVAGVGFGESIWLGTTTVDLPPNAVAEVDVVLAPAG